MATTTKTCNALTQRGEPCNAPAGEDGFCYFHSPAHAVQRLASQAQGGKARHGRRIGSAEPVAPIALKNPADVLSLLEESINDARQLENSLNRARTIGYLAMAACKVFELGELADRIAALEAAQRGRVQ